MKAFPIKCAVGAMSLVLLAGCAADQRSVGSVTRPVIAPTTTYGSVLEGLTPPDSPVAVAVYDFADQTGGRRSGEFDDSTIVTQGASAVVVDALKSAGGGRWFSVVERSSLANLLKERELIQQTAQARKIDAADRVAPLDFARYLIAGAIVSYDGALVEGGAGASYLGLAASSGYRRDMITVTMRIVDVKTGGIVASVTTAKTIYSVEAGFNLRRYVAATDLLDFRAGVTRTEPTQFAVRHAIDLAILELIGKARDAGLWQPSREDEDVQALAVPKAVRGKKPEPACVEQDCGFRLSTM